MDYNHYLPNISAHVGTVSAGGNWALGSGLLALGLCFGGCFVEIDVSYRQNVSVLVVGAGAAGGNCVVRLVDKLAQAGIDDPTGHVAWVSNSFHWGASRCSGSDKQTYYKLGTSPAAAIAAVDWAKTLTAGGACHEDSALIEAIWSIREFYHLVDLGVPFPSDEFGAFVGYQTDNDPYQSATSAGPLTSRFMSNALESHARRMSVPMFSDLELIDIERRDDAWVCVFLNLASAELEVFTCRYLVLATGGPGMLYGTTVYPDGLISAHGLLFRLGAAGVNLSEWQFGLASVNPRWNVSGSYLQAIPRIYSTNADGEDEREFLDDYIADVNRQASMIFLKGYQWPFDVDHLPDGSSLIDLAVYKEQLSGRRIYLDFTRNGRASTLSVEKLENEARTYLQQRDATGRLPIERLTAINPPAVEFYKRRGVDLTCQALEIALCAQHNNGGIAVDLNWQTTLVDLYAVGELAGTHGVRRPGGSALNAGQVGGHRAACDIFEKLSRTEFSKQTLKCDTKQIAATIGRKLKGSFDGSEVIARIQSTMDRAAGVTRSASDVESAVEQLTDLYRQVTEAGWAVDGRGALTAAFRAESLLLTAMAYLHNIAAYIDDNGGSRGSAIVTSNDGSQIHERLPWLYVCENKAMRDVTFVTRSDTEREHLFKTEKQPVRRMTYESVPFEQVYLKFSAGTGSP